jgi:hypothetical protein
VETATSAEFLNAPVAKAFGHVESCLVGEARYGADQPTVHRVGRAVDDLRAGAPLGHRLADQQRNERPGEAHEQREQQQRAEVQALCVQIAVDAKQAGGEAQHQHHGQVGGEEQEDAFHGADPW